MSHNIDPGKRVPNRMAGCSNSLFKGSPFSLCVRSLPYKPMKPTGLDLYVCVESEEPLGCECSRFLVN
jgi:hypothetical protein